MGRLTAAYLGQPVAVKPAVALVRSPACPFCGEPEASIDEISPGLFACVCDNPDCGAIGPAARVQSVAVNLWNQRKEPNDGTA